MKTPIDVVKGKITDVDELNGIITIKAKYDDWHTLIRREYQECRIEMIDSRPLSDKQRRTCWSLIGAIADWQGQSRSETAKDMVNEARKIDFLINELGENADKLFSLSNAPMSLVAAYQRYLIHFIIENDIPLKFPLLNFVDDINDYVYACLIHKKCVICGKIADLHHVDRIGMGRNRQDVIQEEMEVLPLCRIHHEEAHTIPDNEFFYRYHIESGIKMDKTLCKIYKVKRMVNTNA